MVLAPASPTLRDQLLGRVTLAAPTPVRSHFDARDVRVALFDFDGTLVDTMDGFADLAAETLARTHGVEATWARKAYLVTSGLPFEQQCEVLFPRDPRNRIAVERFENGKIEGFFAEDFAPDVPMTIRFLRSRAVRVGISSNNYQTLLDRFVSRSGDVDFDVVLGARDGFFKGRDHFNHVEQTFSVRRQEILFVGDSLKDAEKALENGVMFVGRCGTFRASDFQAVDPGIPTVESIGELVRLFASAHPARHLRSSRGVNP